MVCWISLLTLEELPHATDTHSRSSATAASAENRLVLGGSSLSARARTAHLSRDAVLLYFVLSAVATSTGCRSMATARWPPWRGSTCQP